MTPDCLTHRLTTEERDFFQANGYLIVRDALNRAQLDRLTSVVDRVDARERTANQQGKLLSVSNVVHEDDAVPWWAKGEECANGYRSDRGGARPLSESRSRRRRHVADGGFALPNSPTRRNCAGPRVRSAERCDLDRFLATVQRIGGP
jgi:hypothetical protein